MLSKPPKMTKKKKKFESRKKKVVHKLSSWRHVTPNVLDESQTLLDGKKLLLVIVLFPLLFLVTAIPETAVNVRFSEL